MIFLTDDEIREAADRADYGTMVTADDFIYVVARAVEACLFEKFDQSCRVLGWATHHDEPMLFPTRKEAIQYCEKHEKPIALIASLEEHLYEQPQK